jgi:hypothetical protein
MTTTLEPPAERDLPAGRRAQMRADLLRAIASPNHPAAGSGPRRRWAVAAAACLAVTAGVAGIVVDRGDEPSTLAYSGGAIAPEVQRAADQCLADNRWIDQRTDLPQEPPVGTDLTLVNLVGRNGDAGVVFTTPTGIVYCFNTPSSESRSIGRDALTPWLPGPVSIESGLTKEIEGTSDQFAVAGRVTRRVGSVVLEHGDGTRTPANVAGGTFVVIASGPVEVATATLVTYDAAGTEIDRRPALSVDGLHLQTGCFTDPSGNVVKGARPGGACRPAEPWS